METHEGYTAGREPKAPTRPISDIIFDVLKWGVNKGITGRGGKGTRRAQVDKMMEEAVETRDAVLACNLILDGLPSSEGHTLLVKHKHEVKDGIGDVMVTLILLAEMHGWSIDECLEEAYSVIAKRTGSMVDGTFVKDN